jgi:ribonuclease HII
MRSYTALWFGPSASAKVTRDRVMEGLHAQWPQYGLQGHKGYGTREHVAAIAKVGGTPTALGYDTPTTNREPWRPLAKHGPCPEHRRTFAPLKNMNLGDKTAKATTTTAKAKANAAGAKL